MPRKQCALTLGMSLTLVGAAAAGRASATVINVDDRPNGEVLTTQYQAQGLTFGPTYADVRNDTFAGHIVTVPSPPNYVRLGRDAQFTFNLPGQTDVPAAVDAVSWSNLGLTPSSGFLGGYTANAYDVNGDLLGSVTVAPVQRGQGQSIFQTTVAGVGPIHSVVFTIQDAGAGPGLTALDDLTFPTPTAVPEPTSGVIVLGLAGAGLMARRARR